MNMNRRATIARNLQKAINDKLVTAQNARIASKESDHASKTITADQFKNDLDFYMESGIFADSIDFKYELGGNELTIYAGNMSSYCNVCITIKLIVNDGVNKEDLENVLRKVED